MNKIWKRITYKLNPNKLFPGSQDYWEQRYQEGGNSGAGSYNRLAEFKAEVLNEFVSENKLTSLIEFGCGDGNQLKLGRYPQYIGLDVSKKAIGLCMDTFAEDKTKSFFLYDSAAFLDRHGVFSADAALSLDVIYHLVEDTVFEAYMKHLFGCAKKYGLIYSSNFDGEHRFHERDRQFTKWVEGNIPDWKLMKIIKNRYPEDRTNPEQTSKADFYIYQKI